MKRGTKIGWLIIAVSIVLSVWMILGQSSKATDSSGEASQAENSSAETDSAEPQNIVQDDGLVLSSDGTRIVSYTGSGDSVTIPATVSSGANAGIFSSNSNLKHIYVQSGNSTYASFGDCLYSSSMSTLIKVPNGLTSVQLYQSVSTIGANAFDGSSISEVNIPKATTSIASQGSWNPTAIYCEEGSAADNYAQQHGINAIYPSSEDSSEDNPKPDSNGGTKPDNNGGTTPNNNNGTTPNNNGGTTPNNNNGTTPNNNGGTTPDNNGGTTPNNNGGTTPDNNGGTTPNNNGGTTPNNNGGTTPNNNGGTTPNNNGATTQGDNGGTPQNTVTPQTQNQPSNNNAVTQNTGKKTGNTKAGTSTGKTGGHTQDTTPKTADGDIDPLLVLCLAVLAAGAGILIYTRFRKKVIVASEDKHGLDD